MKRFALAAAVMTVATTTPVTAADLIVNGGFEDSSEPTTTPPGWTNVGHSEGVITYAAFGTPVYQGLNYYDLGGFGDAFGPTGDGIEQTVATLIGSLYTLSFGLSSENSAGTTILNVLFNGVLAQSYTQDVDGTGVFQKPFTTQTLSYLATSSSTTISFIQGVTTGSQGNNDPLIDGVSFQTADVTGSVPEPATWAMMLLGFAGIGHAMRRRAKVSVHTRFA
jgi:hypothetical protein